MKMIRKTRDGENAAVHIKGGVEYMSRVLKLVAVNFVIPMLVVSGAYARAVDVPIGVFEFFT